MLGDCGLLPGPEGVAFRMLSRPIGRAARSLSLLTGLLGAALFAACSGDAFTAAGANKPSKSAPDGSADRASGGTGANGGSGSGERPGGGGRTGAGARNSAGGKGGGTT